MRLLLLLEQNTMTSVVQNSVSRSVVRGLDYGMIASINGARRVPAQAVSQLNRSARPLGFLFTPVMCVLRPSSRTDPRNVCFTSNSIPSSSVNSLAVARQQSTQLASRSTAGCAATSASQVSDTAGFPDSPTGNEVEFSAAVEARVLAVVGTGTISPYSGATWEEVMRQMVRITESRTTPA